MKSNIDTTAFLNPPMLFKDQNCGSFVMLRNDLRSRLHKHFRTASQPDGDSLPEKDTVAVSIAYALMCSAPVYQNPIFECYDSNPDYYFDIGMKNSELYTNHFIRTYPYAYLENYRKILCVALDGQHCGLPESIDAIYETFSLISEKVLNAFFAFVDTFDGSLSSDANAQHARLSIEFYNVWQKEIISHNSDPLNALIQYFIIFEGNDNPAFAASSLYLNWLGTIRTYSQRYYLDIQPVDLSGITPEDTNLKKSGFKNCGWLEQAFVDSFIDNNSNPISIIECVSDWMRYYAKLEINSVASLEEARSLNPKEHIGYPAKTTKFWSKYGAQFIKQYGYLNFDWAKLVLPLYGNANGIFCNIPSDFHLVGCSVIFCPENDDISKLHQSLNTFNPHLFAQQYLLNAMAIRIENDSDWYLNGSFEESEAKKHLAETAVKDKRISKLETELAAKQNTIEKLQQDVSELRKYVNAEYYEKVGTLEKRIEKLTAQLEESTKHEEMLLEEVDSLSSLDHMDNVPASDYSLPLPALSESFKGKKLAVVGGHPRLQRKLKQFFPDLVMFASSNDLQPMESLSSCDYVFLIPAHISHSDYFRAMTNIKNAPYAFLSGTSPEILGNQMYTVLEKQKKLAS